MLGIQPWTLLFVMEFLNVAAAVVVVSLCNSGDSGRQRKVLYERRRSPTATAMNLTVDTEITGRPAGARLSRRMAGGPEAAAGDWFNTLNSTRDYTHRRVYTDLRYKQHACTRRFVRPVADLSPQRTMVVSAGVARYSSASGHFSPGRPPLTTATST